MQRPSSREWRARRSALVLKKSTFSRLRASACRADLPAWEGSDQMAGLAAFEHAQSAMVNKAAHGRAHGFSTKASAAGEPGDGKAEPKLSLEAAVPHEMIVDDA